MVEEINRECGVNILGLKVNHMKMNLFIHSATQLLWCIFFLCWAPEYQEKMVEEINRECGANVPGLKVSETMLYSLSYQASLVHLLLVLGS